ncbi:uncharacterized protein V6R79_006599 [Siganus canaliculatus]
MSAESTSLPTHRQCTIELKNESTYPLCSPSVFIVSGICEDPLPPFLRPSESGSVLFKKTPNSPRGAVGVLTYHLLSTSGELMEEKMAVMFSNPFDFNLYSNWFAVGFFDKSRVCDSSLYEEMYKGPETTFVRGKAGEQSLTYKGQGATIKASMSDTYTPGITVEIAQTCADSMHTPHTEDLQIPTTQVVKRKLKYTKKCHHRTSHWKDFRNAAAYSAATLPSPNQMTLRICDRVSSAGIHQVSLLRLRDFTASWPKTVNECEFIEYYCDGFTALRLHSFTAKDVRLLVGPEWKPQELSDTDQELSDTDHNKCLSFTPNADNQSELLLVSELGVESSDESMEGQSFLLVSLEYELQERSDVDHSKCLSVRSNLDKWSVLLMVSGLDMDPSRQHNHQESKDTDHNKCPPLKQGAENRSPGPLLVGLEFLPLTDDEDE